MGEISINILGNVVAKRTEAEISWRTHNGEKFVAVVFETHEGWQVIVEDQPLADAMGAEFRAAVMQSQKRLADYVNRRGDNLPDGLTAAGLSQWLLERSDGTAMGVRLRE